MALESVFTALNMRTALRLAEVRGVILLAAAQHDVIVQLRASRSEGIRRGPRPRRQAANANDGTRAALDERDAGAFGRRRRPGRGALPFANGAGAAAVWFAAYKCACEATRAKRSSRFQN